VVIPCRVADKVWVMSEATGAQRGHPVMCFKRSLEPVLGIMLP
jgi:hypothetical protein